MIRYRFLLTTNYLASLVGRSPLPLAQAAIASTSARRFALAVSLAGATGRVPAHELYGLRCAMFNVSSRKCTTELF